MKKKRARAAEKPVDERVERSKKVVLATTHELLTKSGLGGVSVDEVARRSGVAKTTIYRHWPTKVDLVVDAMTSVHPALPTPNTGDLTADLRECFHVVRDIELQSRLGRIYPDLLAASARDPEYAELHQRFNAERQQPVRTVLELAQLRGQLPADLDLDDASDLLIGPLIARSLLGGRTVDERFLDFIISVVVRGLTSEQ